jgi:spermidine synthase
MKTVKNYTPHVVVFISSMGIMIIELVASRIVAKYFGNSLYTWTGIIGVVLGGITLGNYLGGTFADRFDVRRAARTLLFIGAGLVLLVLFLDALVNVVLGGLSSTEHRLMLIITSLFVIGTMFFLPATALGTISPIMAKYALEEADKIGTTVGSIYAAGSAGSIIGTFLSGFVLVPLLGIRTVIVTVAVVLALLTLLIRGKRRVVTAAAGTLCALLFFLVAHPHAGLSVFGPGSNTIYETDSMYSHITVKDQTNGERVLIMDGLIHNRYDPEDPDKLLYEYERVYREATEAFLAARASGGGTGEELRTLTLGGGALTFPSYLERHYPESENIVVEIDPHVIEVAHQYFDIPRNTGIIIEIADARRYVRSRSKDETFDIIYLDVFDSYSIPSHLTTLEFAREMQRVLKPDGVVLVNLIDIFEIGRFLGAYSRTMEEAFKEVEIFTSPHFAEKTRSTFVLAAARDVSFLRGLSSDSGRQYSTITEAEIGEIWERNKSPLLTDDYAPVESLMAPVFLRAAK